MNVDDAAGHSATHGHAVNVMDHIEAVTITLTPSAINHAQRHDLTDFS